MTAVDGRAVSARLLAEKRAAAANVDPGLAGAPLGDDEMPPEPPPVDEPPAQHPDDEPAGDVDERTDRRYLELRGKLLTVAGLRAITPPVPLIEGYLYRDSLAWLGGKPGHGKSFLAVDLACCVGTGTAWHGYEVTAGKVLYLIAEGASGLSRRVDAWALAHGRQVERVAFLPVPVQLLTSVDVAAFGQLLAELAPDLIILDTQARVTVGGEENSSKDMGRFVDALEHLRQRSGACVLTVHHEARAGENLRGSTALEGAATTILRASKDGQLIELTNPKQKDGPEQAPLTLALTPIGDSVILSHEAVGLASFTTESELAVLAVLRDSFGTRGASKTELKESVNLPKTTYYRSINALVSKGLVHERKHGRSTVYVAAVYDGQTEIPTSPTESHEAVG